MAKATGFSCDKCGKFQATNDANLPTGWLVVRVALEKGVAGDNAFELCSNRCLAQVAIERAEADGTPIATAGGRKYKDKASLERAQENGRRTTHKVHHVGKGVLSEGCKWCEEATAPV